MSLVAYENSSDDSENEDVGENTPQLSNKISTSGLFSNLPTPKSKSLKDSTKLFKKHQPVKILIPSLSKLQDDENDDQNEEVPRKRMKPSEKGSTFLSMLPPPKYTMPETFKKNLLPDVLTRKVPTKPKIPPVKKIIKPNLGQESSLVGKVHGEDSDSEEENGDFFSLTKEDIQTIPTEPIDILAPLPEVIAKNEEKSQENQDTVYYSEPSTSSEVYTPPLQPETQELSDEAITQLCGRRGKRMKEQVNIIDVNGDSLIPDSKEWLLKQLSEEQERRRVGRPDNSSRGGGGGGGTTSAHRRKHQITYLAFQAKENEIELKNQWAQNRMTRKQTQSKYGF